MTMDFALAQAAFDTKTILQVVQFFVIFLFSLSFHEAAHAWMAHKWGDETARLMGRMTLNPVAHIDPIGTLLVPGVMLLSSLGVFHAPLPALIGWAKPVPVNPLRFRQYHKGEIMVSLAGPFSNLILVLIGAFLCKIYLAVDPPSGTEMLAMSSIPAGKPILEFLYFFVMLNLALFTFNLIPIHPLDGSHILKIFLSRRAAETYDQIITPYGFFIIIIFINTPVFYFLYSGVRTAAEWLIMFRVVPQ